jgi:5-keto 4-deoxyuronate isomerase
MDKLNRQRCELNIRMDGIPIETWNKMPEDIFSRMGGWLGYVEAGHYNEHVIHWFGNEDEEKHIFAHPASTFLLEGFMIDSEWRKWILEFKNVASKALGFEIKEIN